MPFLRGGVVKFSLGNKLVFLIQDIQLTRLITVLVAGSGNTDVEEFSCTLYNDHYNIIGLHS